MTILDYIRKRDEHLVQCVTQGLLGELGGMTLRARPEGLPGSLEDLIREIIQWHGNDWISLYGKDMKAALAVEILMPLPDVVTWASLFAEKERPS